METPSRSARQTFAKLSPPSLPLSPPVGDLPQNFKAESSNGSASFVAFGPGAAAASLARRFVRADRRGARSLVLCVRPSVRATVRAAPP
eukprot:CAMPEP_0176267592 /NCGR_PEP_ID=MMETSP0121_2-20121125/43238_1 /TAXON_ID=160619 /ORGANISM="Kryptoperidinium foliaceum, Strain CCMP 1326" /LENGTH=88 /DNA_ID=CAMNT_0017607659 /DNA_START=149 /DNA_END=412 /DNA_ORIENTATION=-